MYAAARCCAADACHSAQGDHRLPSGDRPERAERALRPACGRRAAHFRISGRDRPASGNSLPVVFRSIAQWTEEAVAHAPLACERRLLHWSQRGKPKAAVRRSRHAAARGLRLPKHLRRAWDRSHGIGGWALPSCFPQHAGMKDRDGTMARYSGWRARSSRGSSAPPACSGLSIRGARCGYPERVAPVIAARP